MKSWVEFRHCFKNSDLIMLEYSGQWNKTSVTGKKKKKSFNGALTKYNVCCENSDKHCWML